MAFRLNEDIGTGKRGRMTPGRALKRWEAHGGRCVNCGELIDGAREDWFCEHILALENGGTDDDENIGPAHTRCKKAKDAADHKKAAKSRTIKKRHLGISTSRTPMPFGRDDPRKRKMDGSIVDRRTGELWRGK
jgi:hypothetical protein